MISRTRSLSGLVPLALLSCAGLQAQNINVFPKPITFSDQGTGITSAVQSVTLSNNQTGTLSISSIQATDPFAQTNNCGTSMAPQTTCTINVTFNPTTVKYYTGTLTITDSAGNSPQVVNLQCRNRN